MQPTVAVVGHIDHGKTSLLDYIRKSSVAAREAGGITQRVSMYEIVHTNESGTHPITFIDTPGHEAFGSMRQKSARAADIAVLIVASDDGVKPQTLEAHKAIMDAKIPYIVAFTKIDKDTASVDRAKDTVLRAGIYLEGLGGDVPYVAISSKTGEGVTELLDTILLAAEVGGLTLDDSLPFRAVVIESERSSKSGISASAIIRAGTLPTSGFFVSGKAVAPVRVVEDFSGKKNVRLAAGQPVKIYGFDTEPSVGSEIISVATKKEAEALAAEASRSSIATTNDQPENPFRIVIKADTAGSIDALKFELDKLGVTNPPIYIAGTGVGVINDNDVKLLIGFQPSAIIGFNVKADASALDLAERQHILVETRTIIYELTEWLKNEIAKHVPEDTSIKIHGTLKVLKVFSTTGTKHVLGGTVESGALKVDDVVQILRRGVEVGRGKITNLQLMRADVGTVTAPNECGLQVTAKFDIIAGDTIESHGKHL